MEKVIKETYQITTPESATLGDYADEGWIDEEGVSMVPDKWDIEEGSTPADLAVEYLRDRGVNEASASWFTPDLWYTVHGTQDPQTGGYEDRSFHLAGFTETEQRQIYERLEVK